MVAGQEAVVLAKVGGGYRVFADGETFTASLRGRIKQEESERVVVGDRVEVRRSAGSNTIEIVRPRRTVLQRKSPGRSRGVRIVAANIDRVVVVGAARRPDWDPQMIDRFLAVAEANCLPATLVVNKCDLDADALRLGDPYRSAGYPVLLTSVPGSRGIEALGDILRQGESLMTGPTGVGKSSLLNAIQPGLRLRTGEISHRSHSGRHTTVSAEMHPLRDGGFVVDTPGLRDIGLWGLEPAEVAAAFPELVAAARACRFDNCRHREEPGCAVIAAAERGEVAHTRLASYRRLLDEAHKAARPWT